MTTPKHTQCTREDTIRYIRQGGFRLFEYSLRRRGLSRKTLIEIVREIDFASYTHPQLIRGYIRGRAIERMQMIDKLEGEPLYPHRTGRQKYDDPV